MKLLLALPNICAKSTSIVEEPEALFSHLLPKRYVHVSFSIIHNGSSRLSEKWNYNPIVLSRLETRLDRMLRPVHGGCFDSKGNKIIVLILKNKWDTLDHLLWNCNSLILKHDQKYDCLHSQISALSNALWSVFQQIQHIRKFWRYCINNLQLLCYEEFINSQVGYILNWIKLLEMLT